VRSLFAPGASDVMLARLDRLSPAQLPRWGRMTASRMVCHVSDALRHALGELDVRPVRSPLQHRPVNWLVIHLLPWPRGRAKSPPEFLAREPASWEADVAALRELVQRFASRGPDAPWRVSPVFGRISGRDWGVLAYRHLDHHFRQFGV
jgi:hypothetical protein